MTSTTPIPDYPQFTLINQTKQVEAIVTILRDRETNRHDFVFFADRLFRLLMEEGLAYLDFTPKEITTPTNCKYQV